MRHAALVLSGLVAAAGSLSGCDLNSAYHDAFAFGPAATTSSAARPTWTAASVSGPTGAAPTAMATGDATFDRDLAAASAGGGTVVVYFTAKWCGPCRSVGPTLEGLAAESGGRTRVLKVDFDQSPLTVRRYGVSSLPAMVFVRHGVVVKRMVGSQSRENLSRALVSVGP